MTNENEIVIPNGQKDYEIGHGRPPKSTRFQPGKSGNPSGRPKGSKGLKALLMDELHSVRKTETQETTAMKVIAATLMRAATKGDYNAIGLIMKLDAFAGND
jgi:hypothetical protein